uniref:Ladybird homeobox 2 n=1 Tax=Monodelphis domestica TaxID=13616 RepID=F7BGF7_MONDO
LLKALEAAGGKTLLSPAVLWAREAAPITDLGPRLDSGEGHDPTSPLCALEELASKTFCRLDGSVLQAAEGTRPLSPKPATRRRRKSRTAFTAQQVLELERRFVFQKYLAPAERDGLAARLGLANAQVITWFQNRRAKLKRDVEEMKADVASLRSLPPAALRRLSLSLPESGSSPPTGPEPSPDPGQELSDEEIQVDD